MPENYCLSLYETYPFKRQALNLKNSRKSAVLNQRRMRIALSCKESRVFLLPLVLLLMHASEGRSQTDSVRLGSITYTTGNLDSLTRHFAKLGLEVQSTEMQYGGWVQSSIELPTGQHILLVAPPKSADSFSLVPTLQRNATAITQILLTTNDIELVRARFDNAGIDYIRQQLDEKNERLMLKAFGPTDITISNTIPNLPMVSHAHHQGVRRITWLALTAGSAEETYLRKVFFALGLHQLHEGCCDYWLIGPGDDRTAVRFEIPNPAIKRPDDWLSVEEGGLVLNY